MSKQCKCEHWQQCPVCMPHRFDGDGNLLPPEPTPLQEARQEAQQLREQVKMLRGVILKQMASENRWPNYSIEALAATNPNYVSDELEQYVHSDDNKTPA